MCLMHQSVVLHNDLLIVTLRAAVGKWKGCYELDNLAKGGTKLLPKKNGATNRFEAKAPLYVTNE